MQWDGIRVAAVLSLVLAREHVRVQPADVLRHEVVPRQDPHHRRPLHNEKINRISCHVACETTEISDVRDATKSTHVTRNEGVDWHTYPLRPRQDAHVAEAEAAEQHGGLGQRHVLHDGVR
jgi:hypothetical protein